MSTILGAVTEAVGMKPSDQTIAIAAVDTAKAKANMYLQAVLTSTTPELRQVLMTHLQDSLTEQQRITELAIKRGWVKPQSTPEEQVGAAVQFAKPALS